MTGAKFAFLCPVIMLSVLFFVFMISFAAAFHNMHAFVGITNRLAGTETDLVDIRFRGLNLERNKKAASEHRADYVDEPIVLPKTASIVQKAVILAKSLKE